MHKLKSSFAILFVTLSISSCSTMVFTNGPEMEDTVIREEWHHSAINGLIEISPPLDIQYVCDNKQWDTITIEQSLLNSLASAASKYVSLYSPWTVYYECRENID